MDNLKTTISWILNDYCKSECEYCPTSLRGGSVPHETEEYLRIASLLIDSYSNTQKRKIDWIFNGGEPLDMDDIVMLLKLCRTNGNSMTLHTNGGKLWMDWWAIEPYVDTLHLTFHHWQNPALIKYISDTFQNKGKKFNITSPIRHNHVQQDIERVMELEETLGFIINKTILYKEADPSAGMFNYQHADLGKIDFFNKTKIERERILEEKAKWERELERIKKEIEERKKQIPVDVVAPPPPPPPPLPPPPIEDPSQLVEQKIYFEETTWDDRYQDTYSNGPVYTGQLCNAGVEFLNIGAKGWVSGSNCNNQPLGNIWHTGWMPPQGPQRCTMISCVNDSDQEITKFPLTDL
jgi:organic radical activating enzyme